MGTQYDGSVARRSRTSSPKLALGVQQSGQCCQGTRYTSLLVQSIVEPGFKARTKPGQGLARPSPWNVSWGAGLWRQP